MTRPLWLQKEVALPGGTPLATGCLKHLTASMSPPSVDQLLQGWDMVKCKGWHMARVQKNQRIVLLNPTVFNSAIRRHFQ